MKRTVVCMKWGALYSADYVNVLYSAMRENLDGPFRMVCMTDDPSDVAAEVDCVPIPEMALSKAGWRRGGWPKLSVLKPGVAGLEGRCLFIDLDTVITGRMDEFFTYSTSLVMIREWMRLADRLRRRSYHGASGIFAWTAGSLNQVWNEFAADPAAVLSEFRQEQQFLEYRAGEVAYWPADWVISFKRTLMAPPFLDRMLSPKPVPPTARVLAFHGYPRPIEVVTDENQRWGRGLHYGRGAVPYVREYWLRHGGT